MDDVRPDKILYAVRVPISGSPSFRDVTRCDRHRPTGLPHERLSSDTERSCEVCEHDEEWTA
jgi:hypothetical protein